MRNLYSWVRGGKKTKHKIQFLVEGKRTKSEKKINLKCNTAFKHRHKNGGGKKTAGLF